MKSMYVMPPNNAVRKIIMKKEIDMSCIEGARQSMGESEMCILSGSFMILVIRYATINPRKAPITPISME